ncbi:Hypothetical protein CINCED_3A012973 [Cinara cedri]|nr:Hypothetical protein CINCED_3A012973 [Cinara cedri]
MAMAGDQDGSRWPYFHSMMFIRDQISHTATVAANPLYLSGGFQYPPGIYPEVQIGGDGDGSDEDNCNNPLNCLNIEYDNQNTVQAMNSNEYSNYYQDENISDDKHFLLSLLPIFSTLSPDKKLKARIAIETSLLNIAYPDLNDKSARLQDNQNGDDGIAVQKSTAKAEKRKRTPAEDVVVVDEKLVRLKNKRNTGNTKNIVDNIKKQINC